MTLKLNLVTLRWDGVAGATQYEIQLDGVKVAVAGSKARSTKITIPEGTEHRVTIKALPSGDVQEARFEWGSITPAPPPTPAKRGVGRCRLNEGKILSHAADYDVRIVSWSGGAASGAVPSGLALHYMSALTCSTNSVSNYATEFHYGMDQATARANGWILKDAAGNEITNAQYGGALCDPGLPAAQARYCQNIEARLAATGSGGVWFDDCLRHYGGLSGGKVPAKYPTQPQWEAAMLSFCAAVHSYFSARGYKVGYNAGAFTGGDGRSDTGELDRMWWTALGPHADVLSCEFWQWHSAWPGGPRTRKRGPGYDQHWDEWQALVPLAAQLGVMGTYCTYTKIPDEAQYVAASILLESDRVHSIFIHEPGGNGVTPIPDPWGPLQDKLGALGSPLGPKVTNGNRVQRSFEGGLVWVDPVAGTSSIP